MIKMAECSYLLTLGQTFEIFEFLKLKTHKHLIKLANNIDTTHISLITLTILMISSLTLLVLRNLKEGRKALTEINKDRS